MLQIHNLRYLLLSMILLSLCACAKTAPSPTMLSQDHEDNWQSYLQSGQKNIGPFRTQMSLRYGSNDDTRRVTALLWGNDTKELRLDVNAGIGVNVAKILENSNSFLVFVPREEVAYYHEGTQKPLFNAGVPIPFNLQQLAQIIQGQYSLVFGTQRANSVSPNNTGENESRFILKNSTFAGILALNSQGLPTSWQEQNKQGWKLILGYKDNSLQPYKLTMTHATTGKRAILLIKEREVALSHFTDEQMRLTLPSNISILPLEQAQNL